MAYRVVQTSKQLSAQRQIHAAIKHFRDGNFECAITLCSAAENQMPEPSSPTLFAMLKRGGAEMPSPDGVKDDFNYDANWMKHTVGPEETYIHEVEVKLWLNRAIGKYRLVYGKGTPEMASLFAWAVRPVPEGSPDAREA